MMKENLVAMIEESLKSNWHLPAFSNYKEQEYSFEKVAKKILWLHFIFEKKKIKKGDKIAVIGKNSVNWAISYLATISYGAVIVPILPDFAPDDIHHIVNHSEASLLFSAEDIYEDIDEQKMPNLNVIFSLSDFSVLFDKKNTMSSILEKAVSETKTFQLLAASEFQLPKIDNNSLASIVYTSGTTGFSKGVMLSHNNLVANIVYAQNNMSLKAGDNIVSFMPLAHSYGCAFEFLFPFTLGCHITFLSKIPSPKIIVKAFKEIKPQLVLSVPLIMEKIYKKQIKPQIDKPLIKIMLKIPLVNRIIYKKIYEKLYDSFGGNFHEIVIGGAALNKEVEQFLKKLNFPFTIGYGMTECAPLISYAPWKTHKPKSVGKVVDTLEIKINSENPQKTAGEILMRGENVMLGYYKN
ncbi:MAG: long-chain fatty acid--CoA ligase, partial [Candidatus Cloacimonadota bacterium]